MKKKSLPTMADNKKIKKHFSVKDYFANDPSVTVADLDSSTLYNKGKKGNKSLKEKKVSLPKDDKDKPVKKKVGRHRKEVINVGVPIYRPNRDSSLVDSNKVSDNIENLDYPIQYESKPMTFMDALVHIVKLFTWQI